MQPFDRLESAVRSYCRSFPTIFTKARGSTLIDHEGKEYLDFFAGAGALNYGHNHPQIKKALLDYLSEDGVTHSLDMHTDAKRDFLLALEETVLKPRELDMRVLFPGPTGTNAVEAALKLARKATGRNSIISFTNGFHGMTLGSLSITGNQMKRQGAGVSLSDNHVMPFDGYLGEEVDTVDVIRRYLEDGSSGVTAPAAFVLETIQAEGGVRVASFEWLRRLRQLADDVGALLILDDIQVGCGRTGPFLSFDEAGVRPDIITLSKSLSGYGQPFAIVLVKPEHDVFEPGEHNGTFRGFNPAMVTATEALKFWKDDALTQRVRKLEVVVTERLEKLAAKHDGKVRGRGLIQGLELPHPAAADAVSNLAFERGLIIETSGADGEVLKLLPPLVIEEDELTRGLDVIASCVDDAMASDLDSAD